MAMARNWYQVSSGIVREASNTVERRRMRALHRKNGLRHAAMAGRWLLIGGAGLAMAWQTAIPWLWPFGIALLGLFALDGTVMLHEVLHGLVTSPRRPRLERVLGLLYALPTGISPSQFTRWHLDHHRELGDAEADPKRHHLSPKRNSRLLKAAYWTPALFFIYFRAAGRETATYEPALRRRIARERVAGILIHLGLAVLLVTLGGWGVWLRVQVLAGSGGPPRRRTSPASLEARCSGGPSVRPRRGRTGGRGPSGPRRRRGTP